MHVDRKIGTTINPDLVKKYDAGRDKQDSRESMKLKIELATLIVIFIYTAVAAWQGCSNQRAANAAKSAADTAARALVETNRSWIEIRLGGDWVKPIELAKGLAQMKYMSFPLTVTNIGRFPIKEIRLEGNAEFMEPDIPISSQDFHWNRVHSKEGISILFPERHGDFPVGVIRKDYVQGISPQLFADFTDDDKEIFIKGRKYFVLYARGTFIDGFGKHWVEFCEPLVVPNAPSKYGDCINYNDTGDGDPKWKEVWP